MLHPCYLGLRILSLAAVGTGDAYWSCITRREEGTGRLVRGGSAFVVSPALDSGLAAAASENEMLHRADNSPAAVAAAAARTPFTHDNAGELL